MSKEVAIDPRDWREVFEGVFCRKDDPQQIIFRCNVSDPEEKVKKAKEILKEESKEEKKS